MAERDPAAERFLSAYRDARSPSEAATRAAWLRMQGALEQGVAPPIDLQAHRASRSTKIAIAALAVAVIVALALWLDVGGVIAQRLASDGRGEATYQGEPLNEQGSAQATPGSPTTAELSGPGSEPPTPATPPEGSAPPAASIEADTTASETTEPHAMKPALPQTTDPPAPKSASRAPRAKPRSGEPVTDDATLHAEMTLLSAAQSALAAGNPERALEQLDRHARRFPTSLLAEEREVARIRALCALGRDAQLATARRRFDKRFPGSPLRGRAMAECDKGEDSP